MHRAGLAHRNAGFDTIVQKDGRWKLRCSCEHLAEVGTQKLIPQVSYNRDPEQLQAVSRNEVMETVRTSVDMWALGKVVFNLLRQKRTFFSMIGASLDEV